MINVDDKSKSNRFRILLSRNIREYYITAGTDLLTTVCAHGRFIVLPLLWYCPSGASEDKCEVSDQ